jgi:hypothetical protein
VPAVGGLREIPPPDPVARDYLLLALRLDQRIPGLVDSYFGPADLKAQVDTEPLPAPAALRADAAALRERIARDVEDSARRAWLDAQVAALEVHAARLAGESFAYLDLVERFLQLRPAWRDEEALAAAIDELDRIVPGSGPLAERIVAWDEELVVPPDRLGDVAAWLASVVGERAGRLFGCPEGEAVTIGTVRNQPWSAYNWYEGGLRSRIDLNLDLPVRIADLPRLIAHETYPGHHLEHAWRERRLVEERGWLEASVLVLNTPESVVSEGLAEAGVRFVLPPDEAVDRFVELFERSGLRLAADRGAARDAAERLVLAGPLRDRLGEAVVNAALLRHVDGATRAEVVAYLRRWTLVAEERAAKRFEFLDHPMWRTYVFVYDEGEAVIDRWLEVVPPEARVARFERLYREPLTPARLVEEATAGDGVGTGA